MSLKLNNDTANGSVTLQASNTATGDVVSTLPPFSTELAPRMQLMTAKTASGTSIDFTGIPSWVKRITVMFNGVSTNGSSVVQVQIGSGSVTTSGYQSISSTNGANVALTSGFISQYAMASTYILLGKIEICLVSGSTYVASGVVGGVNLNTTMSAGNITLGGVLDRVRITTVNGTDTFDAGSINILVEG